MGRVCHYLDLSPAGQRRATPLEPMRVRLSVQVGHTRQSRTEFSNAQCSLCNGTLLFIFIVSPQSLKRIMYGRLDDGVLIRRSRASILVARTARVHLAHVNF